MKRLAEFWCRFNQQFFSICILSASPVQLLLNLHWANSPLIASLKLGTYGGMAFITMVYTFFFIFVVSYADKIELLSLVDKINFPPKVKHFNKNVKRGLIIFPWLLGTFIIRCFYDPWHLTNLVFILSALQFIMMAILLYRAKDQLSCMQE